MLQKMFVALMAALFTMQVVVPTTLEAKVEAVKLEKKKKKKKKDDVLPHKECPCSKKSS